jgi:hypothetical protein
MVASFTSSGKITSYSTDAGYILAVFAVSTVEDILTYQCPATTSLTNSNIELLYFGVLRKLKNQGRKLEIMLPEINKRLFRYHRESQEFILAPQNID